MYKEVLINRIFEFQRFQVHAKHSSEGKLICLPFLVIDLNWAQVS